MYTYSFTLFVMWIISNYTIRITGKVQVPLYGNRMTPVETFPSYMVLPKRTTSIKTQRYIPVILVRNFMCNTRL